MRRASNAAYRTEHSNQGCEVIRSHVKHWSRARLRIEIGVQVPVLWTVIHHKGRGSDRSTDLAFIDQLDAGLDAASQKGIGSATDAQTSGPGCVQECLPLCPVDGEWLFAVGRFTSLKDGCTDFNMSLRNRQVDNNLNLRVRKQFFDATGFWDLKTCRLGLSSRQVDICTCNNV